MFTITVIRKADGAEVVRWEGTHEHTVLSVKEALSQEYPADDYTVEVKGESDEQAQN